ncbi:MAG: bifunctional oligoribonuclease/PAP phosphatase NrnA [Bacteroidota bacterium]
MNPIASLKKIIDHPQNIVITMHHHPDGDAMASALAMGKWCEAKGHKVSIISPNQYPYFLNWLPDIEKVHVFENNKKELIKQLIDQADAIFFLDFSPIHRLGSLSPIIQASKARKVAIDHHPDEGEKLDLLICDTKAAATCSIIYDLIITLDEKEHLSKSMATLLYVGIFTDTSCFVNSNTTPATHQIAQQLLKKGVEPNTVYMAIYGQQSINKLHFIAHCITHRLVVMPHYQAAYFAIPTKDFKKFYMRSGDKAGLVNYALTLENVSLAGLIVEQKKENNRYVTLSLRSVGSIAVNQLAHQYFNGGGHKNAAGAISKLPLSEVVDQFENMIKQELTPHSVH